MELAVRKINTFRFFWRVINDLLGNRGMRNDIPLPLKAGSFELIEPIFQDKKNNKFQYGLYKDTPGKEYIAKQLSMKDPGIDEYKLRNEINAYSILTGLYREKGDIIDIHYPDIKIPKLTLVIDDERRLLFLTEKVSGKNLTEIPVKDAVIKLERSLNYFKFLNTIHDFKNENLTRRNFISMFIILTMATAGALAKHPKDFGRILKGFLTVLGNLPFLLTNTERAFIHRDIGYMNILTNTTGLDYILDFELSSYMHPMWEITQIVVGSRRRTGFMEAFTKTETMKNILDTGKSRRLYKLLSIYCGIHILSTSGRDEERVISDKKYLEYALSI